MAAALSFLSVTALAEGYRAGRFIPRDICAQAMARLRDWEPRLNAFIDPMTDAMMRQTDQATRSLARGEDRAPLHGIPVAIKDIIDVAGVETTCATRALPPRRAARDADCVRRLRAAGAIVFGKTNLLEFAYGIAHPAFGQTNNPCDPARTAGGSSGGSAAAVAAGIVPLALGTDTGGSVRAPAAYCGIVGLKPSFGLLSLEGVYPLSPSLDHLGLLGRTVADVALGLAALAPSPTTDAGDVASIRLGVCRSQWDSPALRPQVRLAGNAALGRLKSASVTMVDIALPSPQLMTAALLDILLPEAALVHAQTYRDSASGYAPGTAAQIEAGLVLPAVRYLDAKRHQQRWTAELGTLFEAVDAIISPTHANLTGAPSLSLPCRRESGLPVGLQLTGKPGADAALLALARRLEPLL